MPGRDPEIDKWIDQALEDYATPRDEDTPSRIVTGTIRRIENWHNRKRRLRLLGLAGALSFACAVVVVLLLRLPGGLPPLSLHSTTAKLTPPAIRDVPTESRAARTQTRRVAAPIRSSRSGRAAVMKPEPAPKLEQFPMPSPLTAEERAMVAFASRTHLTPQEAEQLKPPPVKPLQIPALETDALQIAAFQSKPIAIAQ